MKRVFQIFDLSKNEQRVALIVIFVLIALALIGYERRVHRVKAQPTPATETRGPASSLQATDEH